jgi:hypothetical protein
MEIISTSQPIFSPFQRLGIGIGQSGKGISGIESMCWNWQSGYALQSARAVVYYEFSFQGAGILEVCIWIFDVEGDIVKGIEDITGM